MFGFLLIWSFLHQKDNDPLNYLSGGKTDYLLNETPKPCISVGQMNTCVDVKIDQIDKWIEAVRNGSRLSEQNVKVLCNLVGDTIFG